MKVINDTASLISNLQSMRTSYNRDLIEFLELDDFQKFEDFLSKYRKDLEFLARVRKERRDTLVVKEVDMTNKVMDKVCNQICLIHIARGR